MNRVHINVSIGHGHSWYSHHVMHGPGGPKRSTVVFRERDKFYINTGEQDVAYLIRWFDGVYIRMPSYTVSNEHSDAARAINRVKFQGRGSTIPISLSSHVDLWRKIRVGLGGTFFINTLEYLAPEEKYQNLGVYTLSKKVHYHVRPFLILGFKVIDHSILSVLLDTNLGFDFLYAASDSSIEVDNAGMQSVGLTIERNISAYFRLFGRLSYEISESDEGHLNEMNTVIVRSRTGVLLQLGFSFNCPEIPRCSLPGCRIEYKHKHCGKSYRGVSIFTGKDKYGCILHKK